MLTADLWHLRFAIVFFQYPSSKTVLVRNVGRREAKFTLETERCDDVYVYTMHVQPCVCGCGACAHVCFCLHACVKKSTQACT